MVTKKQIKDKILELMPDLVTSMLDQADRYINSGALDLDNSENNFMLPKIILTACIQDATTAYESGSRKFHAEVNNLRKF